MSNLGSKGMGGDAQLSGRAPPTPLSASAAIPLSPEAQLLLDANGGADGAGNRQGRQLPRGVDMASFDWMTQEERDMVARYGFEWDEFGGGFSFDQVLSALRRYKKLHGSVSVPGDYVVPFDYEWPRELAGLSLGPVCQQLRCGDIYGREDEERRAALDALGFDWGRTAGAEDDPYLYFQYDEVLCGLFAHKIIRGDVCVRPDWVVPDQDPWPLPLRGLPLGFLVNMVRWQRDTLRKHYLDRFTMIDAMGFVWLPAVFQEWEGLEVEGVANSGGRLAAGGAGSAERVAAAEAAAAAAEAEAVAKAARFEELLLEGGADSDDAGAGAGENEDDDVDDGDGDGDGDDDVAGDQEDYEGLDDVDDDVATATAGPRRR
ncbi:unnamed protein product [Phaeothamnion confervicola]